MPNFCCAYGCSACSDINKDVMFHQFPDAKKDKERYLKWFHAIKRKNFKPSKATKLCSLHFLPSDYTQSVSVIGGAPRLKKDAVPSVFNFPDHLVPKKPPERRVIVRHVSQPQEISHESHDDFTLEMDSTSAIKPSHSSVGVQTVITGSKITETISELRKERESLRKKLARRNTSVSTMSKMIHLFKKESLLDDCADHSS
ncbi:hypothetical protein V9T40_012484 [Parthenolecanium corni]|uniref:THAP-type domain-containing protein n=1 Tax=Parthenolecanium corni TaxID=536013 RepID=A0AAN9Y0K7_9HEMI